jgi:hypothetical protein
MALSSTLSNFLLPSLILIYIQPEGKVAGGCLLLYILPVFQNDLFLSRTGLHTHLKVVLLS